MSKAPMNYTEEDVERGSDAKDWQEAIDSAVQSLRQHNLDEWELHLIARRVKAALSSIPRHVPEWQDIATHDMQKHGRHVMGFSKRCGVTEFMLHDDGWTAATFNGQLWRDTPILWQPLPAPPAPKEER